MYNLVNFVIYVKPTDDTQYLVLAITSIQNKTQQTDIYKLTQASQL